MLEWWHRDPSYLPSMIKILGVTPGLTLAERIQDDGSFAFPLVPPGTYDVEFAPSRDTTPTKRTITIGKDGPAHVEVPLRVEGFRAISVTVAARPADAVTVGDSVRTFVVPFLLAETLGATPVQATIDARRNYEFLNVQPGRYRVFLADIRYRDRRIQVGPAVSVVVGDEDISITLTGQ